MLKARLTQVVVNQTVHVVQVQHDAGATGAAASQKERARVLESEGDQITHHLQHNLRAHEREHLVRRSSCAAPTVARAVRDESEGRRGNFSLRNFGRLIALSVECYDVGVKFQCTREG